MPSTFRVPTLNRKTSRAATTEMATGKTTCRNAVAMNDTATTAIRGGPRSVRLPTPDEGLAQDGDDGRPKSEQQARHPANVGGQADVSPHPCGVAQRHSVCRRSRCPRHDGSRPSSRARRRYSYTHRRPCGSLPASCRRRRPSTVHGRSPPIREPRAHRTCRRRGPRRARSTPVLTSASISAHECEHPPAAPPAHRRRESPPTAAPSARSRSAPLKGPAVRDKPEEPTRSDRSPLPAR